MLVDDGVDGVEETLGTDMEVEYHPSWKMKKVYICPREIPRHRGNPQDCGKLCRNAQGETDPVFEDEQVLRMVMVRKRTIFDHSMCFDG